MCQRSEEEGAGLQRHFWDLTFISVRPLKAVSNFLMRHMAIIFQPVDPRTGSLR
jgi:hypothetical protein